MPIYDFKCEKCNHQDELMMKIECRDGVLECPECSENAFKKVINKLADFRWNCSLDGVYDKGTKQARYMQDTLDEHNE